MCVCWFLFSFLLHSGESVYTCLGRLRKRCNLKRKSTLTCPVLSSQITDIWSLRSGGSTRSVGVAVSARPTTDARPSVEFFFFLLFINFIFIFRAWYSHFFLVVVRVVLRWRCCKRGNRTLYPAVYQLIFLSLLDCALPSFPLRTYSWIGWFVTGSLLLERIADFQAAEETSEPRNQGLADFSIKNNQDSNL